MRQVGINITFTGRSGRDLVNEFTNNALGEKTFKVGEPYIYGEDKDTITEPDQSVHQIKQIDDIVNEVLKESNLPVQATKSVKANITLKHGISTGPK